MDLILFGIQGSGKGTQGKVLAEQFGLKIFEMGNELRQMISSGTPLGLSIKQTVESGNLVSDDTIMQVIESFLSTLSHSESVLWDGIPRTKNQAQKLLDLLKKNSRDAFAVLINISEEEAINRLIKRRVCSKCKHVFPASYSGDSCSECGGALITRQDDNAVSIQKRIEHFKNETQPVIDQFYKVDRLIKIDGEQSIDAVSKETIDKVGYLFD